MDAYIYCVDLFCAECAEEIQSNLGGSYNDDGESDSYPQGPYQDGGGESDTPQHCGSCGLFLENPLTTDGLNYVLDSLEASDSESVAWTEWAPFYEVEVLSEGEEE